MGNNEKRCINIRQSLGEVAAPPRQIRGGQMIRRSPRAAQGENRPARFGGRRQNPARST